MRGRPTPCISSSLLIKPAECKLVRWCRTEMELIPTALAISLVEMRGCVSKVERILSRVLFISSSISAAFWLVNNYDIFHKY